MAIETSWTDQLKATGNALSYVWGQCTRWVSENLNWVGSGWGNAYQWLGSAQKAGYQTGSTPAPGAVAVWGQGPTMPFGHVAIVQKVDPKTGAITVSEENWLGSNIADLRTIPSLAGSGISGFIYGPGAGGGLPNPLDAAGAVAGAVGGVAGGVMQGIGEAASAAAQDVGIFFQRQLVALVVAVVVAYILFS